MTPAALVAEVSRLAADTGRSEAEVWEMTLIAWARVAGSMP